MCKFPLYKNNQRGLRLVISPVTHDLPMLVYGCKIYSWTLPWVGVGRWVKPMKNGWFNPGQTVSENQRLKKSWIWVNVIIIIHIQWINVWPTLGWYWNHFLPVDSPLLTHPSRLRLFRLWHLCSDLPWPGQSMATTKKPCSASAGATLSEFEGHDLLRIIEKQFGWKHLYTYVNILYRYVLYIQYTRYLYEYQFDIP